jgi:hypothetical protein
MPDFAKSFERQTQIAEMMFGFIADMWPVIKSDKLEAAIKDKFKEFEGSFNTPEYDAQNVKRFQAVIKRLERVMSLKNASNHISKSAYTIAKTMHSSPSLKMQADFQ